jgi:hypothetical protein
MYRIELSPGEETVFRSIEELAVAIKRGVVTPRARIYHNATSKWLPIGFHPHYKAAVSMPLTQSALVAGPPVKPLSSLSLHQEEPEPPPPITAREAKAPPAETPTQKRKARSSSSAGKRPRRSSKPRRQLRIALVGALLIGGAQWVLSAPLFSRSDAPALIRAQRHLIAAPAEAMRRVSSPNTAAMIPVLPNSPPPTAHPLEGLTEPRSGVSAPSFGGTASELETGTAAGVEPAPSTIDLAVPTVPAVDSAGLIIVDSTNKKAIRRILRSVSGAATGEQPAERR